MINVNQFTSKLIIKFENAKMVLYYFRKLI